MQSTRFIVYALHDPRDDRPRYVGQTSQPARRLAQHNSRRSYGPCCDRSAWLMGLHHADLEPVMRTLQECGTPAEADEAERAWIHKLTREGFELLNHSDGGRSRARRKGKHATPAQWVAFGNRLKRTRAALTEAMELGLPIVGAAGYDQLDRVARKLRAACFAMENALFQCHDLPYGTQVFLGDDELAEDPDLLRSMERP